VIPAHRAVLQALSNLVAPVTDEPEAWVADLWRTYTLGPREDAVLMYVPVRLFSQRWVDDSVSRVMDSNDAMTTVSCIMLTLNFIRADPAIMYAWFSSNFGGS
jgi:hypothetical protein